MQPTSRREQELAKACGALGICLDIGFALRCPNGHVIRSIARVRDVGATNGMLIVGSSDDVWEYRAYLDTAGFGFSVLGEPVDNEAFDIEGYRDMFLDWGWRG